MLASKAKQDRMPRDVRTMVVPIIIVNGLPLAGIVFWDWSIVVLLFSYWIEAVTISLFGAFKILLCPNPWPPPIKKGRFRTSCTFLVLTLWPLFLIGCIQLALLIAVRERSGGTSPFEELNGIQWTAAAVIGRHGLAVVLEFLRGDNRKTNIGELFHGEGMPLLPALGGFLLWFCIAIATFWAPSVHPAIYAFPFVLCKTWYELDYRDPLALKRDIRSFVQTDVNWELSEHHEKNRRQWQLELQERRRKKKRKKKAHR